MNLEISKKTLIFISCLIFIEKDNHNVGRKELVDSLSKGFTIMKDKSDNMNFKLKDIEVCTMSNIVELKKDYLVKEYQYGDLVFRLGCFCIDKSIFYVLKEDNPRCIKLTFDTMSHTNIDLESSTNMIVKTKELPTKELSMVGLHTEELLIINLTKQDLNGDKIEIIGTLDKSWKIETKYTEEESSIDNEDYDAHSIKDLTKYFKNLPDEFTDSKNKSLKESFSDISRRNKLLIEHPILEDEINIETKTNIELEKIFEKLKPSLSESQLYLLKKLDRAHKLDFVDELPIDEKIFSNYTLLKLKSSQYVSRDISNNKTNIKETERNIYVYDFNKEKFKISLRKKKGLCRNCVTVNFKYFGKLRKFKYSPKKHNVSPIFHRFIDFSTCDYKKKYFIYDNPVITYVDEFYNDCGNYFRITIKRKSYVLNPRIQLLIMMRYIKIINLGKSAWDYLLLTIYLIFGEIENMFDWDILGLKESYLQEVQKAIYLIKSDLNHSNNINSSCNNIIQTKITFCFFDTLFSSKTDSCDKLKYIKQKIKKSMIKRLCKQLEALKMFSPSFLNCVFIALEEAIKMV